MRYYLLVAFVLIILFYSFQTKHMKSFTQDTPFPTVQVDPPSLLPDSIAIPNRARRHVFFCRTFAGDKIRAVLFPSILAFLDLTRYHLVIILDAESPEDHEWAAELATMFAAYMPMNESGGVHIGFSLLPSSAVLAEAPYREVAHINPRYSTPGFTRMVYDQFFFDSYLPSNLFLPFDNLYIVDADGPLFSFFLPIYDTFCGGRITPPLFPSASHWKGDEILMKRPDGGVKYDTMWTDAFPQAYRLSTFARTRSYITSLWNTRTFEEAWILAKVWRPLSPANVLLNIGIEFESESYSVRMPHESRALAVFGSNRPRRRFARLGCCRTFGVPKSLCVNGSTDDFEHLSFLNNLPATPPLYTDAQSIVAETYKVIHDDLRNVPQWQYSVMRRSCEDVAAWTENLPE